MSIYSDISKRLGWQYFTVTKFPSKEVAELLLTGVEQGKVEDFETVFRFYRFAQTPDTMEGIEIYKIIEKAYLLGREKFS